MLRYWFLLAGVLLMLSGCGREPATLAERGLQQARAGKYDEAIATCAEAIGLDPKDAAAYYSRGLAYQYRNQQGDLDRAVADFTESIRLAPRKVDAYLSRSIAYRDLGDNEHAEADQTAARDLDVELKEVYAQLPPSEAPVVIPTPTPSPPAETQSDKVTEGYLPPRTERGATEDGDSLFPRSRPADLSTKSRSRTPDELPSRSLVPPSPLPSAGAPKSADTPKSPLRGPGARGGGVSGILDDQPGPSFDPQLEAPLSRPHRPARRPMAGEQGPPPPRRPVQPPFPQRRPSPTGVVRNPLDEDPGDNGPSPPNYRVQPPAPLREDLSP